MYIFVYLYVSLYTVYNKYIILYTINNCITYSGGPAYQAYWAWLIIPPGRNSLNNICMQGISVNRYHSLG